MRTRSLRARLALLYGGLTLGALLVVGGGAAAVVLYDVRQDAAERAAQGLPPEPLDPGERALLIAIAALIPLALVGGALGGYWIAGRALTPLERLRVVLTAVSADDLSRRVPVAGGREVEELAETVNALLGRLERSLGQVRRFTSDAAHELRTPLAALRGQIEVALRGQRDQAELRDALGDAIEEVTRLSSLVEALLLLARSDEARDPGERTPVDVAELARRVVERERAAAVDAGIELRVEDDGPAHALGDARLLERAIGNLVGNALLHSHGRTVVVSARSDGGRVALSVTDDGAGVPEAERAQLFERFHRGAAAQARSGFGLGLSIARAIAERHGGSARHSPSPSGGSRFVLELPAAATVNAI